jgi:hypothetical protein
MAVEDGLTVVWDVRLVGYGAAMQEAAKGGPEFESHKQSRAVLGGSCIKVEAIVRLAWFLSLRLLKTWHSECRLGQ